MFKKKFYSNQIKTETDITKLNLKLAGLLERKFFPLILRIVMSLPFDILVAIDLPYSTQHLKWFLFMGRLVLVDIMRKDLPGSDCVLQDHFSMSLLPDKTSGCLWDIQAQARMALLVFWFGWGFFPSLIFKPIWEHWAALVSYKLWPDTTLTTITILGQKTTPT